jgi:hypothetical protein
MRRVGSAAVLGGPRGRRDARQTAGKMPALRTDREGIEV